MLMRRAAAAAAARRAAALGCILGFAALAGCGGNAAGGGAVVADTRRQTLEQDHESARSMAVDECSSDRLEGAATAALIASRAEIELNGYARSSANVAKGLYYAALADAAYGSRMYPSVLHRNPCPEVEENIRALAVPYLQDAYDADEKLFANKRGSDRPQIMALIVRTAGTLIPDTSGASLQLQ